MTVDMMDLDESYYDGVSLQQFLTYRLARLNAKLNTQASRILTEYAGITLTQWRVIALVGGKGQITLTEIHKATQMDKGQLSRTIKIMLADGLVTSQQGINDQRQQVLQLSESGESLYRQMLPRMRARQKMLLDSLSDKEKALIFSAIDKLEIAAEKPVKFDSLEKSSETTRKLAG